MERTSWDCYQELSIFESGRIELTTILHQIPEAADVVRAEQPWTTSIQNIFVVCVFPLCVFPVVFLSLCLFLRVWGQRLETGGAESKNAAEHLHSIFLALRLGPLGTDFWPPK